jgi:hypothetical protein
MKVGTDKFVREERRLLRQFGMDWLQKNAANPEQYPAELERGEWLKQFNFWVEARAERKAGDGRVVPSKVTHEEKRKNVIGLAIVNPTLSMSAIARHFGYSEAFVAKVTREHGRLIHEEQNWRRELEGRCREETGTERDRLSGGLSIVERTIDT